MVVFPKCTTHLVEECDLDGVEQIVDVFLGFCLGQSCVHNWALSPAVDLVNFFAGFPIQLTDHDESGVDEIFFRRNLT